MKASQGSDECFIGHPPDAFASTQALSRAAHSANDLGFVARECDDHRYLTDSTQTIHDRGAAAVRAGTFAGFVAHNRIGRRDGPNPTYPSVVQHTGQYCDAPNPRHPSVAQHTAQYCDAPKPGRSSVALARAVHRDEPNPKHPSLAQPPTQDCPTLDCCRRLARPRAQPDRAEQAPRVKRADTASR